MKTKNNYYVVIRQQMRAGQAQTVYQVMSPTGELYSAFSLYEALTFKGQALIFRRKR